MEGAVVFGGLAEVDVGAGAIGGLELVLNIHRLGSCFGVVVVVLLRVVALFGIVAAAVVVVVVDVVGVRILTAAAAVFVHSSLHGVHVGEVFLRGSKVLPLLGGAQGEIGERGGWQGACRQKGG